MSHVKLKTTYNTEGAYGETITHTLYVDHNNTSDFVTFYDEDGDVIFVYQDCVDNNLFEAMLRLEHYWEGDTTRTLREGVEYLTDEDRKKINKL